MSRSHPDPAARVIPAQVNFLTIYNPSLGNTDDTERDQIVFWASREDVLGGPRKSKSEAKENRKEEDSQRKEDDEFNDRLMQIGLARGMVEFAKNFSDQQTVNSIETEKSRIILHELEQGWWILASIDLTRLPTSAAQKQSYDADAPPQQYEYSTREVAPPQLLLQQLLRAHRMFLLHHATSLWDIHHKLGRSRFCALLHKYWERFAQNWDVLLHGNPATDIYGCCTRLAGGGELGMGVGEEEWGSGEREVLEGFIDRTEGLVDMLVGRYGAGPVGKKKAVQDQAEKARAGRDLDPWLGHGENPGPADGIVFSGNSTVSRRSLATVSEWMEAIFKHGERAYGVGENPSARPRQRRGQRSKAAKKVPEEIMLTDKEVNEAEPASPEPHPKARTPRGRSTDLRRQAMENSSGSPGIPAPLVGTVERSLEEAVAKAAGRSSSRSPQSSPNQEKSEDEAMAGLSGAGQNQDAANDSGISWFDTDKMTKVFTLGYGSSWTLNPKGFKDSEVSKHSTDVEEDEAEAIPEEQNSTNNTSPNIVKRPSTKPAEERLRELEPTPDLADEEAQPFIQRLEQSRGKFLIGLSGDLENAEFEEDDDGDSVSTPQRIYLRTLTVECTRPYRRGSGGGAYQRSTSLESRASRISRSDKEPPEAKTSAAASIDGPARPTSYCEKVQVAVYVHQPFIFLFLFELHTSNLTIPGFYRNIHHQLGPLQGPLLRRTDPERVAERIKEVILSRDGNTSAATLTKAAAAGNTVFDLVFDPSKLTIRTSIPNIPVPLSVAAAEPSSTGRSMTVSGSWYTLGIPIGSNSTSPSPPARSPGTDESTIKKRAEEWTRMDALSVHNQILNSWIATRSPYISHDLASSSNTTELERTVKTNRGWWVLWMKVPPSPSSASIASAATELAISQAKEAFLIRKSANHADTTKATAKSGPSGGRWLLREQNREVSRGSIGSDGVSAGARGISEGVGIDARKWVEGLLHLSQ